MKQQLRIMLLILAMIAGGASSELHAMDTFRYVDNDGTVKTRDDVTVLNDVTQFGNLAPGWYIMTNNIECNGIRIEVSAPTGDENGDVHIIIQNGVTMDITDNGITIINEHGTVYFHAESNEDTPGMIIAINSIGDKTIYANCDITFNGLNVEAKSPPGVEGIYSDVNITVNSGSITATGGGCGIHCYGSFTMNGGTVDVSSEDIGIQAYEGVFFNGGNLTANGTESAGIYGNVTLKWTSPDDSFTANKLYGNYTVTIDEGCKFIDNENNIYSGDYYGSDFPKDFTLTPYIAASVTSFDGTGDVLTFYYEYFGDAIYAAKSRYVPGNGSDVAEFIPTVTLLADVDNITEGYTIGDGSTTKKMTLDLNGHDLSGNGEGCLFTVYNNAVLSVVDNSGEDVEKGTVSYNNETAQAAIKVEIGGTLNTKSVSFACVLGDAIYNAGTAEIDGGNISGLTGIETNGTITVSGTSISGTFRGIDVGNGTTTIGSGVSIDNNGNYGIYYNGGKLTFNALPTFSQGSNAAGIDIDIVTGRQIAFGTASAGTYEAPENPIVINFANEPPYTFTSGYSTNVRDAEDNVIDPSRIFVAYSQTDGYVIEFKEDKSEAVVNRYSTDFSLSDNDDNSSEIKLNRYGTVTLAGRTITKDGTWNTLCLPFDVTLSGSPLQGFTVKELNASTSSLDVSGQLTINFTAVTDKIVAGKPYILKWEGESAAALTETNLVFPNVTITSTEPEAVTFNNDNGEDCKFVGQYSSFNIEDDDAALGFYTDHGHIDEILFFAKGDATVPTVLGYSASERTLRACRTHFWAPVLQTAGGEPVSPVRSFVLDFGDGTDATGVVELKNSRIEELNSDDGWYSMDGRKLSGEPKAKGVYIHNGKKMIIK